MVQGLQLIHAAEKHMLLEGNTLLSMELLAEAGILHAPVVEELREDYLFLRRTEHYLQLLEDRQVHSLPRDKKELNVLAKRMLGAEAHTEQFMDRLNDCLSRIRSSYEIYLLGKKAAPEGRSRPGTR